MRILEFGAFWSKKVKKTTKSRKLSEIRSDGVTLHFVTPSLGVLELEDFTHVASENFGRLQPDGVRCISRKGVTF